MGKRFLGFLVAITLATGLVPPASAEADEVDLYRWGVKYFVSTGSQKSAHFGLGSVYNGTNLIPFDGCGSILARPAKGAGVVEAVGLIDKTNLIQVFFDEFQPPSNLVKTNNGIGANITIDGAEDHEGKPTHPKAFARVAAYGHAHIEIDGYNFTEDGKEPKMFWASLFVTKDGYRDNDTKAILTTSGVPYTPDVNTTDVVQGIDDWEMHLSLEAPGPKRSTMVNWRSRPEPPPPAPLPPPLQNGHDMIVYQEEHVAEFPFNNLAPGGKAEFRVTANSRAPQGETSLKFTVIAPGTKEIANFTLTPHATQSQPPILTSPPKVLNLPLNQFGEYKLRVEGKAVLANYQITGRIVPPPRLDFTMWWEDVTFGRTAVDDVSGCKERLLNELTSAVMSGVGREDPPQMNVKVVAVASGVSIVGILFLVKLVSDAIIAGQFRSVFGGKK